MLIPKFELNQNDSELYIAIHAPNATEKEAHLFIKGSDFRFTAEPYVLHLNLPGSLLDIEELSTQYEADGDTHVIVVNKTVKGEIFKDLDKPSQFIVVSAYTPRSRANSFDSVADSEDSEVPDEEISLLFDLSDDELLKQMQNEGACALPPTFPSPPPPPSTVVHDFVTPGKRKRRDSPSPPSPPPPQKYGFANHFSNAFVGFTHKIKELFDLENPDTTPRHSLNDLKFQKESNDFNEDHYLSNLWQKEALAAVLNYKPVWQEDNFNSLVFLTDDEFARFKEIPVNEWSKDNRMSIYLGAVDILLAYCYNNRITEGEPSSASAKTINKLSASLSWLETFKTLKPVLVSFMRRSLSYPKYRNWDLSLKVVADVESLLRCNKLFIQKQFLQIHSLFDASKPRHLLNKIFIADYCNWISDAQEIMLKVLADQISKTELCKEEIGFNLSSLEKKSQESIAHLSDMAKLTSLFSKLKISKKKNDLDSDDRSSDSSNASASNE